MAAILQSMVSCENSNKSDFMKLTSNPMFAALRDTLLTDVQTVKFPDNLVKVEPDDDFDLESCDSSLDPSLVAVQEASLMSDFQQIIPTGNQKVFELQEFYNKQCSVIENERNLAIQALKENNMLSAMQYHREMNKVHVQHDQQRMHLTNRVTASLQLLKISIPCEVSSSKVKGRQLNSRAVDIMNEWFESHIDHPYPTDEEKQILADMGDLSMSQVKAWFANKRNRTHNTKPKKEKKQVEKQLLNICTELSMDNGGSRQRSYGDIIQQLNDIVKSAPVFGGPVTLQSGRISDAYNSSGDETEGVYYD